MKIQVEIEIDEQAVQAIAQHAAGASMSTDRWDGGTGAKQIIRQTEEAILKHDFTPQINAAIAKLLPNVIESVVQKRLEMAVRKKVDEMHKQGTLLPEDKK